MSLFCIKDRGCIFANVTKRKEGERKGLTYN